MVNIVLDCKFFHEFGYFRFEINWQIKFGIGDMPRRFGEAGKPGFYLRVIEEGEVKTGDEIEITSRADDAISVADLNRLLTIDPHNHELLEAALATFELPKDQRDYLISTQGT